MHKLGLCCRLVSVCPSVMLVDYIQTAEVIIKLLCWPGSPIILVFLPPVPIPNLKRNPLSGGKKYTGCEIFCDFQLKSPSISEMVRDRPMIAMER